MAHINIEHWTCAEDLTEFQGQLRDQVNEIKKDQGRDMFARELAKHDKVSKLG